MATAAQRAQKKDLGPDWRETLAASIRGFVRKSVGVALIGLSIALGVALVTHSSTDPSLSTAAGGPPANWIGSFGAYASDAMLFLFGPASALFLPLVALIGLRMVRGVDTGRLRRALLVAGIGVALIGIALGLYAGSAVSGLPAGYGGALGLAGAYGVDSAVALVGNPAIEGPLRLSLMAILALAGFAVGWMSLGIRPEEKQWAADKLRRDPTAPLPRPRRTHIAQEGDEEGIAAPPRSRPVVAVADPAKPIAPAAKPNPKKGKGAAPGQASLALGDNYQLPSLDLLAAPPEKGKSQIDRSGLERNARLLESVLEDFHVRGDIVEVRPGPVVTMYELEPASGIKASRVIQLADDIARNMSALSARVATIPGRSVIGIELPNTKRESVALSELIGSQAFEDQNMSLPLILGKNISGDPVIADLAPMPHLLVAGTTGSGKSVGLNCMILSLLYRMSP
ncbi:MAG TPA: DNA translocase FtsK 4TM domain-containing protein, partial [Sphingomicrobium sp.]|nr:DNA translocase FtsK 4TM domain-containing protein [Sphingomicrobium sp.]